MADDFIAGRLRGVRVLFVEDNDDSRDVLTLSLRYAGLGSCGSRSISGAYARRFGPSWAARDKLVPTPTNDWTKVQ
jgi:hypothetical protein